MLSETTFIHLNSARQHQLYLSISIQINDYILFEFSAIINGDFTGSSNLLPIIYQGDGDGDGDGDEDGGGGWG